MPSVVLVMFTTVRHKTSECQRIGGAAIAGNLSSYRGWCSPLVSMLVLINMQLNTGNGEQRDVMTPPPVMAAGADVQGLMPAAGWECRVFAGNAVSSRPRISSGSGDQGVFAQCQHTRELLPGCSFNCGNTSTSAKRTAYKSVGNSRFAALLHRRPFDRYFAAVSPTYMR